MATIKGGEKFSKALAEITRELGASPAVLRVGFLEDATYPDGMPVAAIAAIHNFGAPRAGIPPRPFFSNMVKDKSAGWPEAMAKVLKSTNYDVSQSLNLLGMGIKGQLQQAINDFVGVPLKPATIERKGFEKQLIDTGHMLNSVDFEVKQGEVS